MKDEKQIEEMCAIMSNAYRYTCEDTPMCPESSVCHRVSCQQCKEARLLLNAGYRKQTEGEWIRYPHNSGIYCSLCKHKRRYRDIHDAFCPNCGAKMKGGAE